MFGRFKNFVLSTFAKNVPLIIKNFGGGVFSFRWALFYLGEGIIPTHAAFTRLSCRS